MNDLVRDWGAGLRAWRIWTRWAWIDIRQRYQRSAIGPFWMTISLSVTVAGMSVVMGALFRIPLAELVPFLTTGMVLWSFVSGIVTDSCYVFATAAATIRASNVPLSVYVYRMILRNFIALAHHAAILFAVFAIFGVRIDLDTLLVLPALLLYALNGFWLGFFLGGVCARFRDIPQVTINLLQLLFFLTPIMWMPQSLGDRVIIAHANPLFHFIDIARVPLLGGAPLLISWIVCVTVTILGIAITLRLYRGWYRRIAGWV